MWLIVAIVVVAVGVVAGLVAADLSSNSAPATAAAGSNIPTTTLPTGAPARSGLARPQVAGTVASVGSTSFTVTTPGGATETVNVTSSTTFSGAGITGLSSLKTGATVGVYGTTTSSSAITATRVTSFAGGGRGGFFGGGGGGAFGSITAIGSNSFTISTRGGTTETIDVSASTTYSSSGGTLSGLSALKTGEDVIVTGTTSGSTVNATAVRVFQPGAGGGFGGGGFGGAGGPAT
jgi:hypothetical protein